MIQNLFGKEKLMTDDNKGSSQNSYMPNVEKSFFPKTDPSDGQASVRPSVAPRETDSLPPAPPASDD